MQGTIWLETTVTLSWIWSSPNAKFGAIKSTHNSSDIYANTQHIYSKVIFIQLNNGGVWFNQSYQRCFWGSKPQRIWIPECYHRSLFYRSLMAFLDCIMIILQCKFAVSTIGGKSLCHQHQRINNIVDFWSNSGKLSMDTAGVCTVFATIF